MNADKFKDGMAMEKTAKTAISRTDLLSFSLNSVDRVGFISAFIGVHLPQIAVWVF